MSDKRPAPEGWKTSSGLAVDDADITIEDVQFRYDGGYNNGETLVAVFTMRGEDGEELEQFFPCGKGWEPAEKGAAARHENGRTAAFNKKSAYGQFCDSALDTEAYDVIAERGPATQAGVWKGLKFHVETKTETFKINGEDRTRTAVIATKFLGVDGDGDDKKAADKPARASSAPKKDAPAESNGMSSALKAKLSAIAKKHDTHDAFMEEAFGVDGVLSDTAVEQAVMDTSESGLYAAARS